MNPIVTISGGGIIGNYISLRLNQSSIESVVIEKSKNKISANKNIRTVTLNPYSKKLLDDVGIKIPYAKIKKINVFDGEGKGSIDFSSDEINEENLSFVVYFNDLEEALKKNVLKTTFFETEIKNFKENNNGKCEITLSNDKPINSIFLAGCDGRNSNVAKLASLKPVTSNYEQTAITFTASANLKNPYTAYQIFSERGIFAIMPLPSSTDQSFYTIVWSVDNMRIEEQSIEDFIKENISYFEKKLKANIKVNSDILSFSLSNHHFENYVTGSLVLIGDAAHSIHPLAGQGINLGFADADAFCEEITNAYQAKINIDKHLVLKRYEIRRKNMNLLMLKSMDFFVNLFKSNNLYIKLLRNFGLSRVNKTQFLKKFFINHASGKNKI
jgi:ubiquinone biosynthesis UbiH/UbiF/VisC/COQ6 family hydroxylase